MLFLQKWKENCECKEVSYIEMFHDQQWIVSTVNWGVKNLWRLNLSRGKIYFCRSERELADNSGFYDKRLKDGLVDGWIDMWTDECMMDGWVDNGWMDGLMIMVE